MHEWTDEKNRRRCYLIDKCIDEGLDESESTELGCLQEEMLSYRRFVAPLPMDDARNVLAELNEAR